MSVRENRSMALFFLVDTSGSMSGVKMTGVNSAISEAVSDVVKLSRENEIEIKIGVMQFSYGAKWITTRPVRSEDFTWQKLNADGLTDFGAMCRKLNEKLSGRDFSSDEAGIFAPVIIVISDGEPTDEYKNELSELWKNRTFSSAIRVAVAIGEYASTDILAEFTGSESSVTTVHTSDSLVRAIRLVTSTAIKVSMESMSVPIEGNVHLDPFAEDPSEWEF